MKKVFLFLLKNMFEPDSIYATKNFIDNAKSLLEEMNLICKIMNLLNPNMKNIYNRLP